MNEDVKGRSSETAYVPVKVVDRESNVKLKEPLVQGFSNGSKNIDDINVFHSHNVGALYGQV